MSAQPGRTATEAPMRDARDDWRRFDAGAIPTKESTPRLDSFLQAVKNDAAGQPLTLLDVGCGSGRLSRRLFEQGFSVLGIDISPGAIHAARQRTVAADAAGRSLRFEEADVAADDPPRLEGGPFHVVVCQLVISIIGTIRQRANLLRHVHDVLRPSGHLFLSASGVSDTINAGYARGCLLHSRRAVGNDQAQRRNADRRGMNLPLYSSTAETSRPNLVGLQHPAWRATIKRKGQVARRRRSTCAARPASVMASSA